MEFSEMAAACFLFLVEPTDRALKGWQPEFSAIDHYGINAWCSPEDRVNKLAEQIVRSIRSEDLEPETRALRAEANRAR